MMDLFARKVVGWSMKPTLARDLAREDVFDYIEVLYNRKRRHSHLGGDSPEAFEQASF